MSDPDISEALARGAEYARGEMPVSEAARKGGETTKDRHGLEHFTVAGRKGGQVTKDRHGHEHYVAAGRRGGEVVRDTHDTDHYREMSRKGRVKVDELMRLGREAEAREKGTP